MLLHARQSPLFRYAGQAEPRDLWTTSGAYRQALVPEQSFMSPDSDSGGTFTSLPRPAGPFFPLPTAGTRAWSTTWPREGNIECSSSDLSFVDPQVKAPGPSGMAIMSYQATEYAWVFSTLLETLSCQARSVQCHPTPLLSLRLAASRLDGRQTRSHT